MPVMTQLLMPVSNGNSQITKGDISTITLDEIKSKGLKFPENNPLTNVLYIQHPVKENTYILFEEHELALIYDKIMDFALLVQFLGAKELKVETDNSSSSLASTMSKFTAKLKVDLFSKSVEGSYDRIREEEYMEHLSQKFKIHQKYCPKESFTEPENISWLNNEPKWQQLILQRKKGISHWEETFETNKVKRYSSSKYDSIKASFEYLLAKVSAGGDCLRESQFFYNSNAKICVKVYFATDDEIKTQKFTYTGIDGAITIGGDILEKGLQTAKDIYSPTNIAVEGGIGIANRALDLIGKVIDKKNDDPVDSNNSTSMSAILSQSNRNDCYIKEFIELSKDEPITGRERKKLCDKYGITVDEALKLEESCAKSELSVSEKEYLKIYQQSLLDKDPMSNRERKALCERLGLSIERALELETENTNPPMPDNESAYLNEYKELIKDGDLSNRERRQLAQKYAISEERALEIEKL